jgi:hyperosmotically inducible protein
MQTRFRHYIPALWLGVMVAFMGLAGCHTESDRTMGRKIDDRTITHHVKHALAHEPIYKYPNVHVETYDGVVQLSGFVDTAEQKTRAAELARKAEGVRDVINNITIKPPPGSS